MKLLLINTCGTEGRVGLAEDGGVVAEEQLPGRSSSENLLPAIRRLLAARNWRQAELDAVAVVDGPGSFTGVRIGLSAAKGLCDALNVKLIAMSRLALVAAGAGRPEALAVLDAGRGDYFVGIYTGGVRVEECMLPAAQLPALAAGRQMLTCEARVAEGLRAGVHWDRPPEVTLVAEPGPHVMLGVALARIAAGEYTDAATADANYLRRTDAELLQDSR